MTAEVAFVDTNILVYAYDTDAGNKRAVATERLARLWEEESGRVSTQVLQEFYVTVTRKLPTPLDRAVAREIVAGYAVWHPFRPDVDDLVAASQLEERHRLSFWDAMIIVAAQQSRATSLLSEDLQDSQTFGGVRVTNPFA
jgi:predicted nucleic acid-binding protein